MLSNESDFGYESLLVGGPGEAAIGFEIESRILEILSR